MIIEARGIEKTFRIPSHRIDSLKERAVHPFASASTGAPGRRGRLVRRPPGRVLRDPRPQRLREEHAAEDSRRHLPGRRREDSDGGPRRAIHRAGRRVQPRADRPRERRAQRRHDGPDPAGGARRLDAMLDFAELGDFVDLKLKNYSSGMMVRLAFAVMIQAEADIMLIDEVLAVGDAAFHRSARTSSTTCGRGRTIVLVTHDITAVQRCATGRCCSTTGELVTSGIRRRPGAGTCGSTSRGAARRRWRPGGRDRAEFQARASTLGSGGPRRADRRTSRSASRSD